MLGRWTTRSLFVRAGVAALSALLLSGCQSVQGISPSSPQIKYVNASPDSNGLDFLLSKQVQTYNLAFTYKTSYIPITLGNYTAAVANSGADAQLLAQAGVSARSGQLYTVIASDVMANLQLTVLTDQSTPAPGGAVDLRLVNESTSNGAVDVYFVPQGGKLVTTNPVAQGLTFGQVSPYIALNAGNYQMVILPAGTVPIATTVAAYAGPMVSYAQGTASTIVMEDNPRYTTPTFQITTVPNYPAD